MRAGLSGGSSRALSSSSGDGTRLTAGGAEVEAGSHLLSQLALRMTGPRLECGHGEVRIDVDGDGYLRENCSHLGLRSISCGPD